MNDLDAPKPPGLTDEEWAFIQARRARHGEMNVLADKIGRANDRYARQRARDEYRAFKKAETDWNRKFARFWMWVVIILVPVVIIGLSICMYGASHPEVWDYPH